MTDVQRVFISHTGDDHCHHPWQGHALKWKTDDVSESLAGLHLALYQVLVFLQLLNGYNSGTIPSYRDLINGGILMFLRYNLS